MADYIYYDVNEDIFNYIDMDANQRLYNFAMMLQNILPYDDTIVEDILNEMMDNENAIEIVTKPTINHQSKKIWNDVSNFDINYESKCSICLSTNDVGIIETECNHTFHKNCLEKWLEHKKTCPICRKNINLKKLRSEKLQQKSNEPKPKMHSPIPINPPETKISKILTLPLKMDNVVNSTIKSPPRKLKLPRKKPSLPENDLSVAKSLSPQHKSPQTSSIKTGISKTMKTVYGRK